MSLYNGPARGGNRGGKDQFNWESVKSDKDREFYLGHSVKATTGRWQKGKDVFWYTREKEQEQAEKARLETQAIKQREEDLMNEALGLKPKTIRNMTKPKLNSQDMAKLMGPIESEEQAQPDPNADPDAVKGLGYAPNLMTGGASAGHDVLKGIGVDDEAAAPSANLGDQAQALPGPPPKLSLAELERMQKEQKKIAKKAHKAAKKAKKAEKKAKKHKRKDADARQNGFAQPAAAQREASSASDHSSGSEDEPPAKQRRLHSGGENERTDSKHRPATSNRQDRQNGRSDQNHRGRHEDRGGKDRYGTDRRERDTQDRSRHDRSAQDRDRHERGSSRYDSHIHDEQGRYSVDRRGDHQHASQRHRHDSPSVTPPRRRH